MQAEVLRRYDEVVRKVRGYHPSPDLALFDRAFRFAVAKHEGQQRKSGDPYVIHPVEVAGITADLQLDIYSLCAALLHDTVEDTNATLDEVEAEFGDQVAFLVGGLTKLSKLEFKSREEAQAENVRKLIVAMSRDVRVVLVKLADRLHNLRTLDHMSDEGRARIATETLDIYAPLANRLGINWMKVELEDTSFRHLNPAAYADVVAHVSKSKTEREEYIRDTISLLKELTRKQGLNAEIQGRPKHYYSIFRKLKKAGIEFEQLHDVTAFRVIVENKSQCYETLGIVHDVWKPVPNRFKDYIAIPKANGYQSLHTTVLGPSGERIEIQIRTEEMHRVAEYGVAAHWAYKEGRSVLRPESQAFTWLRDLVVSHVAIENSQEFLDSVKLDLFSDEVFVFTPDGDIKSLPAGSTPIDFAFAVHSEVGNHAVHAKVNGRLVTLRHELQNCDVVEILTRSDQHPREEWLESVRSTKARQKIREYIQREAKEKAKEMAQGVLTVEFKRYGLRYETLLKSGDLLAAAELLKVQTVEQLLLAVGYGRLSKEQVIFKVVPPEARPLDEQPVNAVKRFGQALKSLISKPAKTAISLSGMDGELMVSYARCCHPVHGDQIVGFVTRGRGVVVHTASCPRLQHLETERRCDVRWSDLAEKSEDLSKRRVTVRVICRDEAGLLAEMSAAFSSRGVQIAQANCRVKEDGMATNVFEVLVTNVGQLNEAIKQLGKVDGVVSVERVQG